MSEKGRYFDISLLVILALLSTIVFYWDISNSFSISLNDFIIVSILIFSVRLIFYNSSKGQLLLLIVILAALPGILTINWELANIDTSIKTMANFGSVSFNPLAFLLLLFYCAFNRRNILTLIYGSQTEHEQKSNKQIEFYYNKFNSCTNSELNDIYKMFKEYPAEAQLALRRIHEEKNLSFLTTAG